MLKKAWIYLFLLVLFFVFDQQEVKAATNLKTILIAVNDEFIVFPDAIPVIENQTTYVPVRFFSDEIHARLSVKKPGVISLQSKDKSLTMYTNKNEIHFSNGRIIKVNLFVKDGRTYAPLRSLGAYFGYQVHYISEGPLVRLVNSQDILLRTDFLVKNKKKIAAFYKKVNEDQRPKVYLTFDDGPNVGIKDILDILKRKEAKATFFMLEPQMRQFPNDVKRLVEEGHYPALHSVSHNKHLLYDGKPAAVANEMVKSQKTLFGITGMESLLTRAPYGSKPYMVKSFRDELVRLDFKMWDWDVDSLDWKNRHNPEVIFSNVKAGFKHERNGDKPIVILFHITPGTIEALPEIIDYIYSQGYQCAPYSPDQHYVDNFWNDTRL